MVVFTAHATGCTFPVWLGEMIRMEEFGLRTRASSEGNLVIPFFPSEEEATFKLSNVVGEIAVAE